MRRSRHRATAGKGATLPPRCIANVEPSSVGELLGISKQCLHFATPTLCCANLGSGHVRLERSRLVSEHRELSRAPVGLSGPLPRLQEAALSDADAERLLEYFAAAVPAGLETQDIEFLKALPLYPTIRAVSSQDAAHRVAIGQGCATCASDVLAAVVGQADTLPASVRVRLIHFAKCPFARFSISSPLNFPGPQIGAPSTRTPMGGALAASCHA